MNLLKAIGSVLESTVNVVNGVAEVAQHTTNVAVKLTTGVEDVTDTMLLHTKHLHLTTQKELDAEIRELEAQLAS